MMFILVLLLSVQASDNDKNNYDFRAAYPKCVDDNIFKRVKCNNSWAHAFTGAMSDRLCKADATNNYIKLSIRHLTCQHETKCQGPFTNDNIQSVVKEGIVNEDCISYRNEQNIENCPTSCDNVKDNILKYTCTNVRNITGTNNIKAEIYNNGSVMCIFDETIDHQRYYDGIYYISHSKKVNDFPTAYKLVGYGLENGIEYWIGEQSLGEDFGENGYVRYKIKDDLCKVAYVCDAVKAPQSY